MPFRVKEQLAIYDSNGRKTHVVLPVKQFQELLERLEDSEDLKLMKQVESEKSIPWREIKRKYYKKKAR